MIIDIILFIVFAPIVLWMIFTAGAVIYSVITIIFKMISK